MRALFASIVATFVLLTAGGALADAGSVTLNPGQESTVASFTLKAGDVVDYTYSTGLGITFRILRSGTEVFNTSSQATHGTFTASADGTYAFSFRNDGSYLSPVSYSIEKKADTSGLLLIVGVGAIAAVVAGVGIALALRARGRKAPIQAQGPPPPPQ